MKNLNFLIYLKKKKTFFKNYSILNNNNNNNNNSLKDKELLKFSKNIYENTILKNLKEKTWLQLLQTEFQKEYFQNILNFLEEEKKKKKNIYPPENEIFNAFNFTPFDKVKVIIIGQDPYHGEGQAHGLSFSVKKGITPPPSLRNIFKELKNDLGNDFKTPSIKNGNLENWAKQGVLLLNATLTVEANHPNSHANCGW
jgi:uracil-DNA glycosylase